MIRVVCTRDSVCAGDDCDAPHERVVEVASGASLSRLVRLVRLARADHYLPNIEGGRASRIVESGRPYTGRNCAPEDRASGPFAIRIPKGEPLAVVAQQWPEPRWLVDPDSPVLSGGEVGGRLFFRYWCQMPPDLVYEHLTERRVLPDKYGW